MAEGLDVSMKLMSFNVSFEVNNEGKAVFVGIRDLPPTRKVIIEKYLIRKREIDVWGQTMMAEQSVYEEQYSPDESDDEETDVKPA